jgi:hypothetical protein
MSALSAETSGRLPVSQLATVRLRREKVMGVFKEGALARLEAGDRIPSGLAATT